MSRIYDNQPLRNLPLVNIDYNDAWDAGSFQQGKGVLIEGTIQKRCHFAVTDSTKQKRHYYILFLKIQKAHKRKFDDKGAEIEANFSETKKVNSGYLNSSYRVEAKGDTDRLTDDQTRSLINKAELTKHTDKHGAADLLPLWLEESQVTSIEFELADSVRVKTRGDGPFVASITKLDTVASNVCNYAGGESVGASWTDKIMDMKGQAPTTADSEGVEDDEWDD